MAFATEEIVNHYEVLGVEQEATEADIKRAHKLLARKVHPDKNPDDPKAAEKFHQVSKAREALLDPKQREELDKKLKSQKEKEEKYRKMNEKRRKMQEALERREREGRSFMGTGGTSDDGPKTSKEDQKHREIREKNRKQREKIEQSMKEKMQSSNTGNKASSGSSSNKAPEDAIRVQWTDAEAHILGLEGDTDACSKRLQEMFEKYGNITNVICKNRTAVVEFERGGSAAAATCNPPPGLTVTNPTSQKRAKAERKPQGESQSEEEADRASGENPFYKPNIGSKSKHAQNEDGASSNGHHDFKKKEQSILSALKEKQRSKQKQNSS
eukprot:gb/GECG01001808.1/.p1 GENE.gb/GECG01001808.1/~~gb/GECG01001808.1/.p1  ORF type:complete len:327 (+),score=80.27 gb/GECG01001808.1/:1-981(+)